MLKEKKEPAGVLSSCRPIPDFLDFSLSLVEEASCFLLLPNVAMLQEQDCDSSAAVSGDIATII